MKKLLILFLFLASMNQAFGMKRLAQELKPLLESRNYPQFLSRTNMYKHMPYLSSQFSKEEKNNALTPLEQKTEENDRKIGNLQDSPIRRNWWWVLPASVVSLYLTVDPLLVGTSLAGITFGSFGFKEQCDLFALKITNKELKSTKQQLSDFFFGKKEKELKTK